MAISVSKPLLISDFTLGLLIAICILKDKFRVNKKSPLWAGYDYINATTNPLV
jgi:hypothetical protein